MPLPESARRMAIGTALIILIASILLLADRQQQRRAASPTAPAAGRIYRVGIVYFAPEEGADLCIRGLLDGFASQGFVDGRNLAVYKAHAQAEISNIPAVLQNFDAQDLDVIVPLSTPCLAAACTAVKKKPVVFTYVYDPLAAGAGKSWTDHLPHITGVGSFPALQETFDLIRRLVPGVRAIGTLYNSSEANSRKAIAVGKEICDRMRLRLEQVAITGTSEVFQAAQVLAARDIQALWITGDNTALQAFSAIGKVAADHRLPLFTNDPDFVFKGALAAVGIGWYRSGFEAGQMASRVLRGESPAGIPMRNVVEKKLVLNFEVARALGISFPPDLVRSSTD
jgi:putative tryptophan/tyrosine transport system substrate-binding protein